MGFNADRFMQEKLAPRTAIVAVPSLAEWFGEDEPAQWEVRGLTATELHGSMEAKTRRESIEAIVLAITSPGGDQADAVRKAIGLSSDTPGAIAKRLEMMVLGSIEPKIDLPTAVKLSTAFPIEFFAITNKISELTGLGSNIVKPVPASQTITA